MNLKGSKCRTKQTFKLFLIRWFLFELLNLDEIIEVGGCHPLTLST